MAEAAAAADDDEIFYSSCESDQEPQDLACFRRFLSLEPSNSNSGSSSSSSYPDVSTVIQHGSSSGSDDDDDDSSNISPWMDVVKNDGSIFFIKNKVNRRSSSTESLSEINSTDKSPEKMPKHKEKLPGKFKKWLLAKQKYKKLKSFISKKPSKKTDDDSSLTKKTIARELYREYIVDVTLEKVAANSVFKPHHSRAEYLFGLKLGPKNKSFKPKDKPRIHGIERSEDLPGVRIGDKLMSINGISVNMSNIDTVLRGVHPPTKAKLRITVRDCTPSYQSHLKFELWRHYNLEPELSALFNDESLDEDSIITHVKNEIKTLPHRLYFLSLVDEKDDVIYTYPKEKDEFLSDFKGTIQTLGNMISDVASPPLLSCSVTVLNEIVHIGFVTEGKNIMALAMPASAVTDIEIQHFSSRLAKFLKYMFSSLEKAFTIGNTECFLDRFFPIYFKHYMFSIQEFPTRPKLSHLMDLLPSAHWIPLPVSLKTELDELLDELESGDFGVVSDGFENYTRKYNIIASCVFYKGYLLCSHLLNSDLLDIQLFLQHYYFLELTHYEKAPQIVIWKEVFPSKYQENHSENSSKFEEFHGRCFLLVVIKHHTIVAALLDDSEGCIKHEGKSDPDDFYIQEVLNTLYILHNFGIINSVEKLLHFTVFPDANSYSYNSYSSDHRQESLQSSGTSIFSSESNRSSPVEKNPALSDFENETLKQLHTAEFEMGRRINRNRYQIEDSEERVKEFSTYYWEETTSSSVKMISRLGNDVFYYLHMDAVEGVFIAPIAPNSSLQIKLQQCVLDNFHKSCLHMRTIFERSMRNMEIANADIAPPYGGSPFLQHVKEQGVLFKYSENEVTRSKNSPTNFWVIGRLFFQPEPREIYVCHHDEAPKDSVEMAFRLGFGLSF